MISGLECATEIQNMLGIAQEEKKVAEGNEIDEVLLKLQEIKTTIGE